jgi:hypothetical protein
MSQTPQRDVCHLNHQKQSRDEAFRSGCFHLKCNLTFCAAFVGAINQFEILITSVLTNE